LEKKLMAKIKAEDPKEDGQMTWWTGANKLLAPCTE